MIFDIKIHYPFFLSLPLGPVYWFGLSFIQHYVTSPPLPFLTSPFFYLGYACILIPPFALLALLIKNQSDHIKCNLLVFGFVTSTLIQIPFFYLQIYI